LAVRPLRHSPTGIRIGGERVMKMQRKIADRLATIDQRLVDAGA
jgi:hypothetical protein